MSETEKQKEPERLLANDLGPVASAQGVKAPLFEVTPERMQEITRRNQTEKKRFGQINVGLFFEPKVLTFSPNEMRFLRQYAPGVSVEDAAKKAGVSPEFGSRVLKSRKAQEFMQDKFQQVAIQEGWTVERWFSEGDKVWRGTKVLSREQLDIWKEFGARILPKARPGGSDGGTEKPQITININAVDEAFKRQKAIEAEILDSQGKAL